MKKIIGLLVLIVGLFLLSGYALKKDTQIDLDLDIPPIVTEPIMVGFYIQIKNNQDWTNLLPLYGNDDAVYYYFYEEDKTTYQEIGYGLNKMHLSLKELDETKNGVKTTIHENGIEVTLLASNELEGATLYIYPIYEGDFTLGESSIGTMIQGGVSSTRSFTSEVKRNNEIVRNLFKITITVENTLEQVEIIEMSSSDEVLKRAVITEPLKNYDTLTDTSYVLIKETFRDSRGTTYVKTSVYDEYNLTVTLNFGGKYGLIKTEYLTLNFK